jgi:hypothetical protein
MPRLYIAHVLIIPGLLAALIAVHLGLVWYQKHTQFPGAGQNRAQRRRRTDIAGVRSEVDRVLPDQRRYTGRYVRSVSDQPDLAIRFRRAPAIPLPSRRFTPCVAERGARNAFWRQIALIGP